MLHESELTFALVFVDLYMLLAAFRRAVRSHAAGEAKKWPNVGEPAVLAVAVKVFLQAVVVYRNEGKRRFREDFIVLRD